MLKKFILLLWNSKFPAMKADFSVTNLYLWYKNWIFLLQIASCECDFWCCIPSLQSSYVVMSAMDISPLFDMHGHGMFSGRKWWKLVKFQRKLVELLIFAGVDLKGTSIAVASWDVITMLLCWTFSKLFKIFYNTVVPYIRYKSTSPLV